MATLIRLPDGTFIWEHIKDYYYSDVEKTQANTYVLNSDRDIRIDVGSDQGAIIGRLRKGTLVVIDEEQVNTQWGWKRVFFIKDLPGYLPAEMRDKQKELEPLRFWKRGAWVDWSGLSVWPPPEPPAPEPLPEPPAPEPDPLPVPAPKELYEKVWGIKIGNLVLGLFKKPTEITPAG